MFDSWWPDIVAACKTNRTNVISLKEAGAKRRDKKEEREINFHYMEHIISFPLLLLFFFLSFVAFPGCYHSSFFPYGAGHSVSRKNPKPKPRPMLCSVSLLDWLRVPSDKSLIPWWVCFCILPKICGEACCTWFNFLRTKLIWSSHPDLCVALSLHFH